MEKMQKNKTFPTISFECLGLCRFASGDFSVLVGFFFLFPHLSYCSIVCVFRDAKSFLLLRVHCTVYTLHTRHTRHTVQFKRLASHNNISFLMLHQGNAFRGLEVMFPRMQSFSAFEFTLSPACNHESSGSELRESEIAWPQRNRRVD